MVDDLYDPRLFPNMIRTLFGRLTEMDWRSWPQSLLNRLLYDLYNHLDLRYLGLNTDSVAYYTTVLKHLVDLGYISFSSVLWGSFGYKLVVHLFQVLQLHGCVLGRLLLGSGLHLHLFLYLLGFLWLLFFHQRVPPLLFPLCVSFFLFWFLLYGFSMSIHRLLNFQGKKLTDFIFFDLPVGIFSLYRWFYTILVNHLISFPLSVCRWLY